MQKLAYLFLCDTCLHEEDNKGAIFAESGIARCIKLFLKNALHQKLVLTVMDAYDYLGIFHKKLNNKNLSLLAHNEAFQLYLTYTKGEETYPIPLHVASYFDLQKRSEPKDTLDKKATLNMQVLLKEYIDRNKCTPFVDKLILIDTVVTSQHEIVKRKLNNPSSVLDYVKWASATKCLAQYFLTYKRLTQARDHLAIASFMMQKFYENFTRAKTDNEDPPQKALINHTVSALVR